jgi:hypothetical protein
VGNIENFNKPIKVKERKAMIFENYIMKQKRTYKKKRKRRKVDISAFLNG